MTSQNFTTQPRPLCHAKKSFLMPTPFLLNDGLPIDLLPTIYWASSGAYTSLAIRLGPSLFLLLIRCVLCTTYAIKALSRGYNKGPTSCYMFLNFGYYLEIGLKFMVWKLNILRFEQIFTIPISSSIFTCGTQVCWQPKISTIYVVRRLLGIRSV